MFEIYTYNPEKPVKASFYIQNKGLHSGRPLENPKPNCFVVVTKEPHLFELVYSLYLSKSFEQYIIGSAVPFIRINDVRNIVKTGFERFKPEKLKYLKTIKEIEQVLKKEKERTKNLKDLKIAIALSMFKA